MSILIKGMEMPKNGTYICVIETNMIWLINNDNIIKFRTGEICEIPTPHGRLIDADELEERVKQTMRYFSIKFDINESPTVIESEGKKCQ